MYQVADNQTCMATYGVQAVSYQTGANPVIAMELLETGTWHGRGVLTPEAFDPDPYLAKMVEFNYPYGIKEM
jgi:saccharopine dehydrogenase-like NADP-dependent oxidoreductase